MNLEYIKKTFFEGEVGIRKILKIATPLILSTSSFSIMMFIDRKFLAAYSTEAFSAAAPAGMLAFSLSSIFFGTASYINTFVAQHMGAGQKKKVSIYLWQGIYFTLAAWLLLLVFNFLAEPIFNFIGHHPDVIKKEIVYFKIMVSGSLIYLMNLTLSCFFSGQGKTWTIMWIRFASLSLNVPLDYIMIYGKFGFPEMGIAGAAIATIASAFLGTILFSILIFSKQNRIEFGTISQYKFHLKEMLNFLKYGIPNGIHFVVDISGFTIFILLVGRLGKIELAATNAAWTLNILAFLPMIGIAIALSTLVGQNIGRKKIDLAVKATRNTFIMTLTYILTIATLYLTVPEIFLNFLLSGNTSSDLPKIKELATTLLIFVAIYSVFDSVGLIYSSAIKAAGDTNYVMWATLICSITILVIPTFLACVVFKLPLVLSWTFASLYIATFSFIFFKRYKKGNWKKLSIIEKGE